MSNATSKGAFSKVDDHKNLVAEAARIMETRARKVLSGIRTRTQEASVKKLAREMAEAYIEGFTNGAKKERGKHEAKHLT